MKDADAFLSGRETPKPPRLPSVPFGSPLPGKLRPIRVQAVRVYYESVDEFRKPYPEWEGFERALALEHALLIMFLSDLPTEDMRMRLLKIFSDSLGKKLGRARKAQTQKAYCFHGYNMKRLWERELLEVWNLHFSLRRKGDAESELRKRGLPNDRVRAVTRPNSTPASFLAEVYAQRAEIRVGTARNTLRNYLKFIGSSFLPQH